MAFKGFKSLKKSQPIFGKRVEIQYLITGSGAPEREGWITTGILTENGRWIIRSNESFKNSSFSKEKPTHWRNIIIK